MDEGFPEEPAMAQGIARRVIMNASLTKHLLLPLALAAALSACGGGSSPDTTTSIPATPTLDPDYDIRQLVFSWGAVAGADYYRLFENIDGASGYVRIGADLMGTDYRHDISVLTQDWPNASYLVEACNSAGCAASPAVFATESARAIGYFKASDTVSGDGFGFDVAMSGDGMTLVAGAPFRDTETGAAYVFFNDGGGWAPQALVEADNADTGDAFGRSVALSQDGNTLAIGARNEDGNSAGGPGNNDATDAGAVYVFTRSGTVWTQQAYIKAATPVLGDNFGYDVSLSADGNTLATSAIGKDGNEGALYIFNRNGATWTEAAILKASVPALDDVFGYSVALSGDGATLAVGAIWRDGKEGAVYVYALDGGIWSGPQVLKAAVADPDDLFGRAVSLSHDGNTLAVGADGEASNSISIDEGDDINIAANAGAAYVFSRSGTVWTPEAYIKPPNTGAGDHFGHALDLNSDGNILAVGAANSQGPGGEDSAATGINGPMLNNSANDSGAVYLFHRDGTTWTQGVYVKASNTGPGDAFGSSLRLSADGQSLLVGAFGESSNATGIGGDQANNSAGVSGAAYLY
jgi:hypothetical protein